MPSSPWHHQRGLRSQAKVLLPCSPAQGIGCSWRASLSSSCLQGMRRSWGGGGAGVSDVSLGVPVSEHVLEDAIALILRMELKGHLSSHERPVVCYTLCSRSLLHAAYL